jgi:hypothetical protein
MFESTLDMITFEVLLMIEWFLHICVLSWYKFFVFRMLIHFLNFSLFLSWDSIFHKEYCMTFFKMFHFEKLLPFG